MLPTFEALLNTLAYLFDEKYEQLMPNIKDDMSAIDALIYLNRELFHMIENQIDAQDINYYYPHDTANKSMYHVMIDPAKILLKTTQQQYLFVDYPYWKTILNK